MEQKLKIIKDFYAGIIRDEKSKIVGAASNIEELDIFTNKDYIQAEQLFSSDALPADTEVYSYATDNAGTVFGYGKKASDGKVRIVSVATGGADNPGALATLFTSSEASRLAYKISPLVYHKTTEANSNWLYFITKNSSTIELRRVRTDGTNEATVGTLDGLDGTSDRISMKVLFGELIITNGNFMSKVDKDATFTQHAFTLPKDWEAVDLIPVSDVCIILARYLDASVNFCKGYWWDLTATTQVDDSFHIPSGGPQWIFNHQEEILMMCAINGKGRFFKLSGAFPGAVPQELPGIELSNIGLEADQVPVSSAKMVSEKDRILYFGVYKTDKTGMYALGKLDSDKPRALILSKRFSTSDYSLQKPTGLLISGPNFYAAYDENGTASTVRCESRNSPNRSTQGIYESVWIDDDAPFSNKTFEGIYPAIQPLPSGADVDVFFAADWGGYTECFRPDGTSLNTANAVQADMKIKTNGTQKKVGKVKIKLISTTTSSPKLTAIGIKMSTDKVPASK